ncbi:hypothetical protein [Bdellovibrio svalbardensis]|uniref:DUF5666 domain-containing protein n=1 Tax=Bdellovibrio svalbardensis TaxID=2972972 RepID=A0ABT6DK38_9BACT|nr:hypothetical protein [Bdellovibrio svalbardensis]MDG0816872.1 hypothetical protein [Bdellovibrio svalbardensis]
MIKHGILGLCAVTCFSWSMVAQAAEPEKHQEFKRTGENTVEAKETVEVEAEVVSVNKKTREIKLKSSDGEVTSMIAGDEVKNFAQIKKGDRLKVRYFESLMLELKKGGAAPVAVTETSDISRASMGQKPGGMASAKVTARGTVMSLDAKTQSVTVKGPQRSVVLHVAKKDIFDKIKKGDQIEATYSEALAISVESVKK